MISLSYNSINVNSFDEIPRKHRAAIAQETLGELVADNPIQDKTVSVDTIAITVRINPLFDAERFGFKPISLYKGNNGQKKKNTPSKRFHRKFESITGAKIRLTYTRKFGHWLTVEVSLPKFVCGSNLRVLTYAERIKAIENLSVFVSEKLGFPVNLFDGTLKRSDLFQNIRFGTFGNIRTAIEALKQLKVSNRIREEKEFSNSVAWRNTGKKKLTHRLQIYDKTAERLTNGEYIAPGMMRIESQFRNEYFFRGYNPKSLLKDENLRRLYFAHLPN